MSWGYPCNTCGDHRKDCQCVELENRKNESIIDAAKEMIKAWETLPGDKRYNPTTIDRWLNKTMKPAIDNLRKAVKNE